MSFTFAEQHVPVKNYVPVPIQLKNGGQGYTEMARAFLKGGAEKTVVMKTLHNPFGSLENCKRAYREFVLLATLKHPNLVTLFDVKLIPSEAQTISQFTNFQLITEYGGSTLDDVIKKRLCDRKQWSHDEICYTIYQLLCGINFLHAVNVMHRDLKPNNIVINKSGQLKILDYGLSRTLVNVDTKMTPEVVVPYYRAPEIFLDIPNYGSKVDIWSVGCVLAQILRGDRLFNGVDFYTQWPEFVNLLGTPDLNCFRGRIRTEYLEKIQRMAVVEAKSPSEFLPDKGTESERSGVNIENLRDVCINMLVIDPNKRADCEQLLRHPYFASFIDENARIDPNTTRELDMSKSEQENGQLVQKWKEALFNDIIRYKETQYKPTSSGKWWKKRWQ